MPRFKLQWTPYATQHNLNHAAFGRVGYRMVRNAFAQRKYPSAFRRRLRVSGSLVFPGNGPNHSVAGNSRPVHDGRESGRLGRQKWTGTYGGGIHFVLSGQFCMPLHSSEYVHGQRRMYATNTPPPTPPRSPSSCIAGEMASICRQRLRRSSVEDVGSPRSPTQQSGPAFGEIYLGSNPWSTSTFLSETPGASSSAAQDDTGFVLSGPRRWAVSVLQPAHRHDLANFSQDCQGRGKRNSGSTGLAEQSLVSDGEDVITTMAEFPTGLQNSMQGSRTIRNSWRLILASIGMTVPE